MKRCPACNKTYTDETLNFCLDDGAWLAGGQQTDEPATAILSAPEAGATRFRRAGEASESRTAILSHSGAEAEPQKILGEVSEKPSHSAHQAAEPGKATASRFKTLIIIGGAFLLVIGVIGFAIYNSGWQSKAPVITGQMKLTRLTTSGKATVAAISPDGKYVVYEMNDNGQQSLWMRQTATQSNVQIVPPADVNYARLIFSPDGNYLFYTAAAERNARTATLYQIPMLGGSPKKLLSNISSFMALSPDASQIVFKREFSAEGIDTLMLANVDGTNERRLAVRRMPERSFEVGGTESAPAWSPDGKTIACKVTNIDGGVIHNAVAAIDAASGQETLITSQKFYSMGQLAWLSDQSGLIMLAADELGGAAQLWHLSYPEGEARRVTNDFNNYRTISLTADSSSLVTVQFQRTSSIWIAPPNDVARARQITSGAGRNDFSVRWTPNNKIVFDSNAIGSRNIWIMDTDGGNQRQLTTDGGTGASVSPDGSYIVFVSIGAGAAHIFRMDADGGNVKQLSNGSGEFVPVFSPDGKWVLYNSRESGKLTLWRIPAQGGEPQQLTDKNSYNISVSPDGKWLTANYREDAPNSPDKVAIFPLEGGQPVKILDNIPTRGQNIYWTHDSRSLIYIDTRGGVSNLWTQPVDGGAAKQITDFKAERIFSFDYSRDGLNADSSALVTVQEDIVANIWTAPDGDASRAVQLSSVSGKLDGWDGVAWTPDGKIVYTSMTGGNDAIWIMDADGRNRKRLTSAETVAFYPSVTPDGRYIFYNVEVGRIRRIWRMDIDGGNQKEMFAGSNPQTAADFLVFGDRGLWKVPIDGGEPVKIIEEPGLRLDRCTISPDGKLLACQFDPPDGSQARIKVISVDEGTVVKDFEARMELPARIRWAPDGRSITYVSRVDGLRDIWSQPIEGGEPKKITNFKADQIFSFNWSRDNKLVISHGTSASDVVLIRNIKQ